MAKEHRKARADKLASKKAARIAAGKVTPRGSARARKRLVAIQNKVAKEIIDKIIAERDSTPISIK